MPKFFRLTVLFTLCLCLLGSCVAAAEEPREVEKIAEEYAADMAENLEARAEKYASKVTTLSNGVKVQRTPSGNDTFFQLNGFDISFNNYYLNADNRGCAACHDMNTLMETMPFQPHVSFDNAMGIEGNVQMCMWCHEHSTVTGIALYDILHNKHCNSAAFSAMGGNCWSCHYTTQQGETVLWDEVKHDVMRGITDMSADTMDGVFSWNQDKTLKASELFWLNWEDDHTGMSREGRESSGIEPDPANDGVYDAWTIAVNGEVSNPTTLSINEWIDLVGLETVTMTEHCVENGEGGPLLGNCEITGLNVMKMIEYCSPDESANGVTATAYTDWASMTNCDPSGRTTFGFEMAKEYGGYIVLSIGGEPLRWGQGYPVQLWLGGCLAPNYRREVRELTVSTMDPEPTIKSKLDDLGGSMIDAGISLAEGQILSVGEPFVFEGYANSVGNAITKVELSFDKGQTWVSNDIENADLTRWVWWNYEWTPTETGSYTIAVRATDSAGTVETNSYEIMFNVQ